MSVTIKDIKPGDLFATFVFSDGRELAYFGKDKDEFKAGDKVDVKTAVSQKSGKEYATNVDLVVPAEHNNQAQKSDKELLCMLACNAWNNALKSSGDDSETCFLFGFNLMRKAVGI